MSKIKSALEAIQAAALARGAAWDAQAAKEAQALRATLKDRPGYRPEEAALRGGLASEPNGWMSGPATPDKSGMMTDWDLLGHQYRTALYNKQDVVPADSFAFGAQPWESGWRNPDGSRRPPDPNSWEGQLQQRDTSAQAQLDNAVSRLTTPTRRGFLKTATSQVVQSQLPTGALGRIAQTLPQNPTALAQQAAPKVAKQALRATSKWAQMPTMKSYAQKMWNEFHGTDTPWSAHADKVLDSMMTNGTYGSQSEVGEMQRQLLRADKTLGSLPVELQRIYRKGLEDATEAQMSAWELGTQHLDQGELNNLHRATGELAEHIGGNYNPWKE